VILGGGIQQMDDLKIATKTEILFSVNHTIYEISSNSLIKTPSDCRNFIDRVVSTTQSRAQNNIIISFRDNINPELFNTLYLAIPRLVFEGVYVTIYIDDYKDIDTIRTLMPNSIFVRFDENQFKRWGAELIRETKKCYLGVTDVAILDFDYRDKLGFVKKIKGMAEASFLLENYYFEDEMLEDLGAGFIINESKQSLVSKLYFGE
jgi:archaellum biogenesis ATPase FlaH